jgi:3-oxoacyl-[acyl-carrier-protein] synthase-3
VIYLHGLGHFHPENEITNRFLEELDIGTSHEWIMERVGIRSRRTTLPLDYIRETRNRDPRAAPEAAEYSNPELGARAARMAVERAGIDMADIGMVISGSSAADTATPAEACMVARELGLEVPAFDINSACTSFFTGLYTLSLMQPDRLPAFVLLVAPESLSRTVHYDDRASAVLWGDAGAAAVLSTQVPALARIIGNTLASSPEGADKIVVPRLGHFRQEGRVVQMFAIKRTSDLLDPRSPSARSTSWGTRRTSSCSSGCAGAAGSRTSATTTTWTGTATRAVRAPPRCSPCAGRSGRPATTWPWSASAPD